MKTDINAQCRGLALAVAALDDAGLPVMHKSAIAWAKYEYRFAGIKPGRARRLRWPHANEIASQYLLLVLAEMRNERDLRLPFRAMEYLTPYVAQQLGADPTKQLDGKPVKAIGVRLDLFAEEDDGQAKAD